jgi:hypothetical protein
VTRYDYAVGRLARRRREELGTAATLKLFETAAGSSDTASLTLTDADDWHVFRRRVGAGVPDEQVAQIAHDPAKTTRANMNKTDRMMLENIAGLTDLAGRKFAARLVHQPVDARRLWEYTLEEVTEGAR